ncbi:GspMb/PilO family protein [Haliovirga abyssi]|uniref:Uncharacterized protein n=1 Tax=Haliovirga abyssi TaxID=2996794 RepID=A0AAU9E0E5_9FUSO|nr:GspMb/PilO family protein [Haliovirga abyssi]BDU49785.1 hypothetical protein HLVA_03540 [Haliovirga abyssi]
MKKLNKNEKILLILAIIIIGGTSLFKWGIIPIINYSKNSNKKTLKLEEKIKENIFLAKNFSRYKKALEEENIEIDRYKNKFFEEKPALAQLELLNNLQSEVKKVHLIILNKNVWYSKENNSIYCKLNLEGSYQKVIEFLGNLKNNRPKIFIEQLDMKKKFRSNRLNVNMVVRGFLENFEK